MNLPRGLRKPRRMALLIPLALALLFMGWLVVVSLSRVVAVPL